MDHDHEHAHGHDPGHEHGHAPADFGRAFTIGISLNLTFVAVEVAYGIVGHSMSLVADACHNLSDVLGLALAWGASVLAKRKASQRHTYGMKRASTLLDSLAKAQERGKLTERLRFFGQKRLLIVDELGYLPMDRPSAHLFFHLVARQYERGSMLITTNQPIGQWGKLFGDDIIAAAILDWLLHHSHSIVIKGESYRLTQKRKAAPIAVAT